MTIDLPIIPIEVLRFSTIVAGGLALCLWLRKEVTPAKFISIFETEGVLSARQILAWVIAIYGLSMRAAGRMDDTGLEKCLEWATILFGIGGFVKAAGAIKGDTTVTAQKIDAKVDAENLTMTGTQQPATNNQQPN